MCDAESHAQPKVHRTDVSLLTRRTADLRMHTANAATVSVRRTRNCRHGCLHTHKDRWFPKGAGGLSVSGSRDPVRIISSVFFKMV